MDWKKKLKFVFIVAGFAALILIVLTNIFKMTQVSDKDLKTYSQGLNYLNAKDYENAYFNFSNVSKNSAIYEIALLRQALCADELKDSETATKKFKLFIEKYPDSIFIQKAYYALAQNYFRNKEYNKAEKVFNDIRKSFEDSEYKTAASYYLGVINAQYAKDEKNTNLLFSKKSKAKQYFEEYLKDAPDGRLANECVNQINSLGIPLNQQDYFLIGQIYFKNNDYKNAYNSFNKSYMASSWAYLSRIYRKNGEYQKSMILFEQNYPLYSKNIDEDNLQAVIEAYAMQYPKGAQEAYRKMYDMAVKSHAQGADFILYKLSKYADNANKPVFYNKIYTKYPNGNYAADAVANLFWDNYKKGNYAKAYYLGKFHIENYPNNISSPQITFWMGKLAEKSGLRNEAKAYYQRVLNKYPDDYYAYRASKHLSLSHNRSWDTKSSHKLPKKIADIRFPFNHTNIADDNISLINAILKLNDYTLLKEIDSDNKSVQSWIKYKEGKFATSAILARDAISEFETKPDFSDDIYKLAYQLHYQNSINYYAKEYILDPYLVAALIREESYFNSQAGSSVGAMGLMQLMPATASYIAYKNGIAYSGASSLYNPNTNIELGCAYLDYAKSKLNEDDLLSVASYNGGPNAVRSWKNNLDYRNFDEFIENIPYPETKNYVKKVYRSYWIYLNIY